MKLVDVLREVAPDLAQQIGSAGPALLRSMTQAPEGSASHALETGASERMRLALQNYAVGIRQPGADELELPWLEQVALPATTEDIRAWFRNITDNVEPGAQEGLTPEAGAAMRQEVMAAAGLTMDGHMLTEMSTPSPPSEAPAVTPVTYLDAEFIGIYW